MVSYPKIETIWNRDEHTHKVVPGAWRTPEFAYLADNDWFWTEKVDGTNIQIAWDALNRTVTFNGRTERASIPAKLMNHLNAKFTDELFREKLPELSVILFGEGYGAGIQGPGGRYSGTQKFILFDIYFPTAGTWFKREDVEDIARDLGVDIVPIMGHGSLWNAEEFVLNGFTSRIADDASLPAEGLVMRPAIELLDRRGHRIIAKIKTKDFEKGE